MCRPSSTCCVQQRRPDLRRQRHDLRHAHRRHRHLRGLPGGPGLHDSGLWAWPSWGISAPVGSVVLVLVLGLAFGLVQGFCVGYLQIQPFIVTMAGMFFARGMAAVISTAQLSITAESSQCLLRSGHLPHLPALRRLPSTGLVKMVMPYYRLGRGSIAVVVLIAMVFLVLRYTQVLAAPSTRWAATSSPQP